MAVSFVDVSAIEAIRAQAPDAELVRFLDLVRSKILEAIDDGEKRVTITFDLDGVPPRRIARWAAKYEEANGVDVFYLDSDGSLDRRVSVAIDSDDYDVKVLTDKEPQVIAFDWK